MQDTEDSDEIDEEGDVDDGGSGDADTENEIQEVVITFTNEEGEQKTLIIKFVEQ